MRMDKDNKETPRAGGGRIRIVTTLFRHDPVNGRRQSVIRCACRSGNGASGSNQSARAYPTRLCRSR